MATADADRTELQDHTLKTRKPTAVSRVLQALSDEQFSPAAWIVRSSNGEANFQIRVAANRIAREKAYALAYRVYRRCGYVNDNAFGLCVSAYDAYAGTFTLLAEDLNGREAGTMTVVFDSNLGLPCNEIYRAEVDELRAQGRSLVEFTRLAIDDDAPDARAVLFHLFSLSYAIARGGGNGGTDVLIEVNPRHVDYYKKMCRFEQIGSERACPRVQDAPAVLLRLDFAKMDVAHAGFNAGRDREGRRMHAYPFSPAEEREVVRFLSEQHRAMSFQEARVFNISKSKIAV